MDDNNKDKQLKKHATVGIHSQTDEAAVENGEKIKNNNGGCMDRFWQLYASLTLYSDKYLSVDTRGWIVSKICFEWMEIFLQILLLFEYSGTSLWQVLGFSSNFFSFQSDSSNNESSSLEENISQLPQYIIVYAITIMLNGLITSIMWGLYVLYPWKFYGHIFDFTLFVSDAIFDTIYTVFPFALATSKFNVSMFSNSIAVLQATNWTQFLSSYVPLLLLIYKIWDGLDIAILVMEQKNIGDEYFVNHSLSITGGLNGNYNNNNNGSKSINTTLRMTIRQRGILSLRSTNRLFLGRVNTSQRHMENVTQRQVSQQNMFTQRGAITSSNDTSPHHKSVFIDHSHSSLRTKSIMSSMRTYSNNNNTTNGGIHSKNIDNKISNTFDSPLRRLQSKQELKLFRRDMFRRIGVGFFGACLLLLTTFGTSCAVLVDIVISIDYCSSFKLSSDDNATVSSNYNETEYLKYPELYLYEESCITKVYTLFSDYPCNCRFFQITDSTLNTQSDICKIKKYYGQDTIDTAINNVFKKWTMMERLWIDIDLHDGCIEQEYTLYLNSEFFSMTNLQILHLAYPKLSVSISETNETLHVNEDMNYMENWSKLIFLQLVEADMSLLSETNDLDTFLSNIGVYWQDLIYLNLGNMAFVNQFYPSWCNLASKLTYFEINLHLIKEMNDCIVEFDKLKYFYSRYGFHVLSLPDGLSRLPNIEVVSVFFNVGLNEHHLYSFARGYNKNTLKSVYFQGTIVCDDLGFLDYSNLNSSKLLSQNHYFETMTQYSVTQQDYQEFVDFMIEFDPCNSGCMSQAEKLVCDISDVGNGVCNQGCFTSCNLDEGDCSQTCDFNNICNISTWGNDICDENCNTTQCIWDGYDCASFLNQEYTLDMDCNLTQYSCNTSWINDGICDEYCKQCSSVEIESDCTSCTLDNSFLCLEIHDWWSLLLNTIGVDTTQYEYATQSDLCNSTDGGAFVNALIFYSSDLELGIYSCLDFAYNPKIDVNLNGVVGFWEFLNIATKLEILVDSEAVTTQDKINQVNCSLCMQHPQQYLL